MGSGGETRIAAAQGRNDIGIGFLKHIGSDVERIPGGRHVGAWTGEEDKLAKVAESGGAAVGDAIGSQRLDDVFEGTMNVQTGIGSGEKLGDFRREIFLDGGPAAVEGGVGMAEAVKRGAAGHRALASIGKLKLA